MYYTVQSEMVNGSSGREGTYLEARTTREEFCCVSHRRDKDIPGAFDLSMGDLAGHCLNFLSNIQLEEVIYSLTPAGPSIW